MDRAEKLLDQALDAAQENTKHTLPHDKMANALATAIPFIKSATLLQAADQIESLCYAYEGNTGCRTHNAAIRRAARELRHMASLAGTHG